MGSGSYVVGHLDSKRVCFLSKPSGMPLTGTCAAWRWIESYHDSMPWPR